MRAILLAIFVTGIMLFKVPVIFAQFNQSYNLTSGETRDIQEWNFNKTVTNNCPKPIFVPTKTENEWRTFNDNKPGCVDIVDTPVGYCGDNVCNKPAEDYNSCMADCLEVLWPYDADVPSCNDSAGIPWSTTGPGSLTWMNYGCPHRKDYSVNPGDEIILQPFTDACPPCVCYYPQFSVSEFIGGVWVVKKNYDFGSVKDWLSWKESYTTVSSNIRISATGGCFYINVYRVK
jgi:hypothetical protein